jgi:2-desacetyl-2-hydroxyethyl bacteriochlorophyllide A dehydrogenase
VGTVVRLAGPGQISLVECADAEMGPGDVRISTLFSGISAGTELTAYAGTNPHTTKRWDSERRLFVDGDVSFPYPIDGWGYEEVGVVVDVGRDAKGISVGDVVAGIWGHRSDHVADADWASARKLPDGAEPIIGVFARIGAIALNAVHDAVARVGDVVAVFGLGVPGLLVIQLLRLAGVTVVAVDRLPKRLELARRFDADHVIDFTAEQPAEYIKEITEYRGADVCIEISGSYRAVHEAIRAAAYNSHVVVAGFPQGEGVGLAFGEEFHHNRIRLTSSQISGVNPGIDHRWDVRRLERTVMALAAAGRIDVTSLVSHTFPASDVARAFAMLAESPADALQTVLDFGAT